MENCANSLAAELESQVTIAIDETIPFQILNHNLAGFAEYLPLLDKLPTGEYLSSTNQWRMASYLTSMNTLCAVMGWATVPKQLVLDLQLQEQLCELQLTSYPHTEWEMGKAGNWPRNAFGLTPI
jgi:hypothetical protein